MNHRCQKCDVPIDYDIDEYTAFCNRCLAGAVRRIDSRAKAIAEGRTDVPDLTPEERQKVLAVRRRQRDAVIE